MIDGVEMESGGALKDTKEDEKGDPPGRVLDEHIWRPVKKEVPTS